VKNLNQKNERALTIRLSVLWSFRATEGRSMRGKFDTTFDVYSDTQTGKDPDSHSPTLRQYHRLLWSKKLPDGGELSLSEGHPKAYLHHKSHRGEFFLSSDSIGHTYRYVKAMASIVKDVPEEELDQYFSVCSTVGAYIVFPSRRVDRKPTINGARGLHHMIKDRFDLTLECIRRHYENEESPLSATLGRYAEFFNLFGSFKGYVEFFLLQDLISDDNNSVDFCLAFHGFNASPLPTDVDEYRSYMNRLVAFIMARNNRIAELAT
jgi:hypothetical protein